MLVVWLPLNGDTHNQGLSNITVTNNGATVDNSGKIGKCYSFNGSQYITLPTSVLSNFINEISVCAWINITAWNSSYDSIIKMYAGSNAWNNSIFAMGRNNTASRLYFSIANGSSSTQDSCTLTTDQVTNTWYHIACVYNYTDKNMKIYLNGELKTTYATTIVPNFSSVTSIGIGGSPLVSYGLKGKLNDVRIYNHALSPKEVAEIAKGLVLHYKLNNNGMGGENLAANTSTMKTLAPTGTATHCRPTNFYTQTTNGLAILHNATTSDMFTVSFDYIVTEADTSFNIAPSLKRASSSFGSPTWVSRQNATIPVGDSSGHFIGVMCPTTEQIAYGEGWLINVGADNRNISILISNFKFEQGSKATVWSPAPSDTEYPAQYKATIYDSSGYSNNGSILGTLQAVADSPRYNIATQFDGNTSGIINEALLSNILNTNFTISFWVKDEESGSRGTIFGNYNASPSFTIEKKASNLLRVYWYNNPDLTINNAELQDNIWTFVTLVKTGINKLETYIDGVLKNTNTNTLSNLAFPNTWRIGRDTRSGDATPFKGQLSDFRIYATSFTAMQVKELYDTSMSIDSNGNVYARELKESV